MRSRPGSEIIVRGIFWFNVQFQFFFFVWSQLSSGLWAIAKTVSAEKRRHSANVHTHAERSSDSRQKLSASASCEFHDLRLNVVAFGRRDLSTIGILFCYFFIFRSITMISRKISCNNLLSISTLVHRPNCALRWECVESGFKLYIITIVAPSFPC